MSLNATLRVPLAKNILRGFEAINEEGILCFDEAGLSVMLVDGNRYKMLRVIVPADSFQSYEWNFTEPQEVGVIFARMGAIIKTLTAKDELTLALDQHDENLRFRLLANGISQTVKLLRLDLMNRISEDVSRVRMYLGPAIMYSINLLVLFVLVTRPQSGLRSTS